MSAQLEQILAYLDRPGVTEVVIGNGRPVTFRRNHENVGLTKEPLSKQQLGTLLKGTALLHMVPDRDGNKPSVEIELGSRTCKVTTSRRGDELVFRIEKAEPAMELELSPEIPGRGKRGRTTTPPAGIAGGRTARTTTGPVAQGGRTARTTTSPRTTTGTRAARTTTSPAVPPSPPRAGRTTTRPSNVPIAPPEPMRTKRQTRPAVSASIDVDFEVEVEALLQTEAPKPAARATAVSPKFRAMLEHAVQRNASDLHIATNRPVSIRVLGELVPLDPAGKPATAAEVEALLTPLMTAEHREALAAVGYVDLALDAPGGGRLRANISRFQGGLKGTFRIARKEPATLDELRLPKDLEKLVQHHQGLVVIAGPSGHGKTTTLAALVELINASRPFHIITVEDPIEIVYPRKAAVVSQREVGPHTRSFAAALKGSLREDPDVIVIGELRDRETVEIALTAAETGHLVIATMSTPNAAKTIDRLVDMFPPEDQSQVRASIAGALRAIVAQRLVPSTNGDSVYAAVEVLTGVLALQAMIREDKLFQLPNLMQRGKAFGMMRFDDSLLELVRTGRISTETAIATSDNKKEFAAQLRSGAGLPPGTTAVKSQDPAKKTGIMGVFGRKDS